MSATERKEDLAGVETRDAKRQSRRNVALAAIVGAVPLLAAGLSLPNHSIDLVQKVTGALPGVASPIEVEPLHDVLKKPITEKQATKFSELGIWPEASSNGQNLSFKLVHEHEESGQPSRKLRLWIDGLEKGPVYIDVHSMAVQDRDGKQQDGARLFGVPYCSHHFSRISPFDGIADLESDNDIRIVVPGKRLSDPPLYDLTFSMHPEPPGNKVAAMALIISASAIATVVYVYRRRR